jgi:hypothetical protein
MGRILAGIDQHELDLALALGGEFCGAASLRLQR